MDSDNKTQGDHDSNFLFGLLAINEGLIDGPTLADALAICQERGESVESALVEIRALSEQSCDLIRSLMEQYLQDSDGDLGSLLSGVMSRRGLSKLPPDMTEQTIRTLVEDDNQLASGPTDTVQSQPFGAVHSGSKSDPDHASIPAPDRFRFVKELRRGGLGVVSVAVDGELRREVALKRIRPEKAFDSVYRDKFLREAEITGNLEHPGVVPVYGMGTDALGHLFYAMRLIRGDTLSDMITRHWKTVARGPLAFHHPRLITLIDHFLAACQTIHYAHERGVLHRDLKPDNVMIGSYGETLVVDWGLAKVVNNDQDQRSDQLANELGPPDLTETATKTRFGAAMGTPAYASPELITGQILDVDRRSDVYGLGAILFEILSGQAPVQGRTIAELKARAAAGNICSLKSLAPHVPKPLAAICNKCLESPQHLRYQTVGELIDDLQCWKADQPVKALPDSMLESTGRWLRHHRSIARSGIAALAAAILVALGAGYVLNHQKQQYAVLAQKNGELAQNEAILRERAQSVRDLMLSTFRSPDPRFDGHSVRVSELLDQTAGQLDTVLAKDDATRGQMYLAIGKSYLGMGQPNDAVLLLRKANDIYRTSYGEHAPETFAANDVLAEALLKAGAFQQSRRLLEQTLEDRRGHEKSGSPLNESALQTRYLLAENMRQAGDLESADRAFEEIIAEKRRDAPQVLQAMEGRARILLAGGDYKNALSLLESVYKQYCDKSSPTHPDALKVRTTLAESMQRSGDASGAVGIYRDILKTQVESLGPDHLETITTKNNLAFGLKQMGDLATARELFAETHKQFVERLGPNHSHSLVAANNYAEILESTGDSQDAADLLSETVEQFAAQFPNDHPDLIIAKHNLGSAFLSLYKLEMAETSFRDILAALDGNTEQAPARANAQMALAMVLGELGRTGDASDMLQTATSSLRNVLGVSHPETLKGEVRLATSMLGTNRINDSIAIYERVVPMLAKQLGEQHPDTLSAINQQATGYLLAGRSDDAIALLTKALEGCQEKHGPTDRQTLTVAMNRSVALCRGGKEFEGIPILEATVSSMRKHLGKSHPNTLEALGYLAAEYFRVRWSDQALDMAKKSVVGNRQQFGELHPRTTNALMLLAKIQSKTGDFDAAASTYRDALQEQSDRLGVSHAAALGTRLLLSSALVSSGNVEKAIELLEFFQDSDRLAEQLSNGDSDAQSQTVAGLEQLSNAYQLQKQPEQSLNTLRKAVMFCEEAFGDTDQKSLEMRYNLSVALASAGEHAAAIEMLRERDQVLQNSEASDADRFDGRVRLGISLFSVDQVSEAESVMRECEAISASAFKGQWRQAWARAWLGRCLESSGNVSEAKALLLESQDLLESQQQQLPQNLSELPAQIASSLKRLDEENQKNE